MEATGTMEQSFDLGVLAGAGLVPAAPAAAPAASAAASSSKGGPTSASSAAATLRGWFKPGAKSKGGEAPSAPGVLHMPSVSKTKAIGLTSTEFQRQRLLLKSNRQAVYDLDAEVSTYMKAIAEFGQASKRFAAAVAKATEARQEAGTRALAVLAEAGVASAAGSGEAPASSLAGLVAAHSAAVTSMTDSLAELLASRLQAPLRGCVTSALAAARNAKQAAYDAVNERSQLADRVEGAGEAVASASGDIAVAMGAMRSRAALPEAAAKAVTLEAEALRAMLAGEGAFAGALVSWCLDAAKGWPRPAAVPAPAPSRPPSGAPSPLLGALAARSGSEGTGEGLAVEPAPAAAAAAAAASPSNAVPTAMSVPLLAGESLLAVVPGVSLLRESGTDAGAGTLVASSYRLRWVADADASRFFSSSSSSAGRRASVFDATADASEAGSGQRGGGGGRYQPPWFLSVPLASIARMTSYVGEETDPAPATAAASLVAVTTPSQLQVGTTDFRCLVLNFPAPSSSSSSSAARAFRAFGPADARSVERLLQAHTWDARPGTFAVANRIPALPIAPASLASVYPRNGWTGWGILRWSVDHLRQLAQSAAAAPGVAAALEGPSGGVSPPVALAREIMKLWRLCDLNARYNLSPTYPNTLIVPGEVSDATIAGAAKHRSKGRLPVVTWVYADAAPDLAPLPAGASPDAATWVIPVCLARASQPLTGLLGARSPDDEALLAALRSLPRLVRVAGASAAAGGFAAPGTPPAVTSDYLLNKLLKDTPQGLKHAVARVTADAKRAEAASDGAAAAAAAPASAGKAPVALLIADARPRKNAMGNRAVGGGFESPANYGPGAALEFLGIDNIHKVRGALWSLHGAVLRDFAERATRQAATRAAQAEKLAPAVAGGRGIRSMSLGIAPVSLLTSPAGKSSSSGGHSRSLAASSGSAAGGKPGASASTADALADIDAAVEEAFRSRSASVAEGGCLDTDNDCGGGGEGEEDGPPTDDEGGEEEAEAGAGGGGAGGAGGAGRAASAFSPARLLPKFIRGRGASAAGGAAGARGEGEEEAAAEGAADAPVSGLKRMWARVRRATDMDGAGGSMGGELTITVGSGPWLKLLATLLQGSVRIAVRLLARQSVFVHCSDGWDRTAALTSLAQLYIDPYYRTLPGFCSLIEKEWPAFGHRFGRRYGTGGGGSERSAYGDTQRSPIFPQWCDAVWQVWSQHPTAFEFSEALLVALSDHAHSGRFGTFLYDNESSRVVAGVGPGSSAPSLWSYVLHPDNREAFTNPRYVPPLPDLTCDAVMQWMCLTTAHTLAAGQPVTVSGGGSAAAPPPAAPSEVYNALVATLLGGGSAPQAPAGLPPLTMPWRLQLGAHVLLPRADTSSLRVWPYWRVKWTGEAWEPTAGSVAGSISAL